MQKTFKPQAVYRPLAPRPIGTMRQHYVRRTFKAVYLFATTRYSWHLAWVQAARTKGISAPRRGTK